MLKRFLIGIIIPTFVICHLTFVISAPASAQHVYLGMYWIAGAIDDPDGKGTDGRQVVFFKEDLSTGYAVELAGPSGLSGQVNRYVLNAYKDWRLAVAPGKYKVAVARGADNYGADPVEVTVTGAGYDLAPNLVLGYGKGIVLPSTGTEPAPAIKVWFGKRLYQPAIYGNKDEGKKPFVVSEKGRFKLEVSIPEPYTLDETRSYNVKLMSPLGVSKTFDMATLASVKASTAGIKPFVLESDYPEELVAGADETLYTFTFYASSKGTFGPATETATACAVYVMGGPVRLIGTPVTFPSPLHLRTDKEVAFQYTLSRDANLDIYVIDISARVVKKLAGTAGEEGGSAGVNKLTWNLITDQGSLVASGIYVFSLIDRENNKLLGKGKFTALP